MKKLKKLTGSPAEIDAFLFDESFKKDLSEKCLQEFGCGETVVYMVVDATIDLVTSIYFALSNRPDLAIAFMKTQILNLDQSIEIFEQNTVKKFTDYTEIELQSPWFAEIGRMGLQLKHFVFGSPEIIYNCFGKSTCNLIAEQLKCPVPEAKEILICLVQEATRDICERALEIVENNLAPDDNLEQSKVRV